MGSIKWLLFVEQGNNRKNIPKALSPEYGFHLLVMAKKMDGLLEDEIEPAWTAVRCDASDTRGDDYRLRDSI